MVCQRAIQYQLTSSSRDSLCALGLPSKQTKTGLSTNAEGIKLRGYPIIDEILDYRKVTKLKSTYVDGLLRGRLQL